MSARLRRKPVTTISGLLAAHGCRGPGAACRRGGWPPAARGRRLLGRGCVGGAGVWAGDCRGAGRRPRRQATAKRSNAYSPIGRADVVTSRDVISTASRDSAAFRGAADAAERACDKRRHFSPCRQSWATRARAESDARYSVYRREFEMNKFTIHERRRDACARRRRRRSRRAGRTGRGPRPDADVTRQQVIERVDQRFARLDADHDGRFTPEEARARARAAARADGRADVRP